MHPAAANFGIWFRRVDLTDRENLIPATYDSVSDTRLCTRISNSDGAEVSTIEHVMAALAGCGVHNAIIDIDGPEVPILDGSARVFVSKIMAAGLRELDVPVEVLKILRPIEVSDGLARAMLLPADRFEIDFEIEFAGTVIGRQTDSLDMANGAFVRELADCRTFVRFDEIKGLQAQGLAQGGTLDNAVVVDGPAVLNPGGFRRDNECVRHKMLDALGDLALSGYPIIGRYVGYRAGHGLTNRLLRRLFATTGAKQVIRCSPGMERRLPGFNITATDLVRVA